MYSPLPSLLFYLHHKLSSDIKGGNMETDFLRTNIYFFTYALYIRHSCPFPNVSICVHGLEFSRRFRIPKLNRPRTLKNMFYCPNILWQWNKKSLGPKKTLKTFSAYGRTGRLYPPSQGLWIWLLVWLYFEEIWFGKLKKKKSKYNVEFRWSFYLLFLWEYL